MIDYRDYLLTLFFVSLPIIYVIISRRRDGRELKRKAAELQAQQDKINNVRRIK